MDKLQFVYVSDCVEVVRCKDCKHCFDYDKKTPYDGECEWYCKRWNKTFNSYLIDPYKFYCAEGKRR